MASDKEAIIDSKSNGMFPAASLNVGAANGKTNASIDIPSNQPSGYYQSQVVQKGKLILPTALWILLIVGGLCFISLLATLSKTVGTLDMLVEIEQQKAASEHYNHQHHHHPEHNTILGRPEKLEASKTPVASEQAAASELSAQPDDEVDTIASLFALPPWASLEPMVPMKSLTPKPANSVGGIIIAGDLSPNEHLASDTSNPIEAILGQLMGEPVGQQEQQQQQGQQQQPLIQANIDKVNININSEPREQPQRPQPPRDLANDMLVPLRPALEEEIMVFPLQQPTPTHPPRHQHLRPVPHQHRFHFNSDSPAPLSPISSLLMPVEPARGEGIIPSPMKSIEDFLSQPPPPMFGRPHFPSDNMIVISGELGKPPKRLDNQQDSISEPLNSPYEMLPALDIPNMFGRPHHHHGHDRKQHKASEEELNAIDKHLISSLAQSLFPNSQEVGPASLFDEGDLQPKSESPNLRKDIHSHSMVVVNGEPISIKEDGVEKIKPQEKETESQEPGGKRRNAVKDLFQLFFGQAPKSKLLGNAEETSDEIPKIPSATDAFAEIKPFVKENVSEPMKMENAKQDELETKTSAMPIVVSSTGDDLKDNKEMFELMNSILSAPQFGKEDEPMRVEAQSSGPKEELDQLDQLFAGIEAGAGPEYAIAASADQQPGQNGNDLDDDDE